MMKTPLDQKRRVCVIGGNVQIWSVKVHIWLYISAGTAGLCALKNSLEAGLDAVAYERGTEIGGTWIFSEEMPKDEYDEVHSSMYEGLRYVI